MRAFLLFAVCVLALSSAYARADEPITLDWSVQSLGIAEAYAVGVSVWNGQVAWRGGIDANREIYFWDGLSVTQITTGGRNSLPDLYDGMIAYTHFDGHDSEIYLWDGENHIQITDNDVDDRKPTIWADDIAWKRVLDEGYEIYLWNAVDGLETRITENSYADDGPQVSGGTIAWSIWDGQGDIGWWDGGEDTRITNDAEEDYTCSNYLGDVVFDRNVGGQSDLFLWNGSEIIQLTDTPDVGEIYPSLFDGFIAYHAYDGNDCEIYLWHDGEVFQVTDNDFDDVFPDLWVSDDYIQLAWEGEGTQVMYAVCANPFTVPEPSTLILALSGLLLFRLRYRLRAA